MQPPLQVAVFSDFLCPFCHVARARVAWLREHLDAHVDWLPYDLHPEYPPEGLPREELVRRYGAGIVDAVRGLAAEAGLSYAPHPDVVPNTRRALELAEWARQQGAEHHDRLHDRIMDAYWRDGWDIGWWDALRTCVADVGLDPDAAEEAVDSGAFAEPVTAWTAWAQSNGIAAIPAFVFEQRILVSGAQPVGVLERAAGEARAARLRAAEGSP